MAVEYQIGLKPVNISIETRTKGSQSLTGSTFSIDYFEDLLEPVVSMQIALMGSYNLVSEFGLQGGEKVNVELELGSGTFEKEMYLVKASSGDSQKQVSGTILHLTSYHSLVNEGSRCLKRYSDTVPIDKHVENILKNILKVPDDKIEKIEQTSNTYGFIGNMRKPLEVCQWLCPKAISAWGVSGVSGKVGTSSGQAKGTAGFFFYENADGFHFRSIDSLVSDTRIQDNSADAEKVITYFTKGFGGIDSNLLENNLQIINHYMDRNVDVKKAFAIGLYKNVSYIYDTLNHRVSMYTYNFKNELGDSHLGQDDIHDPSSLISEISNNPTRLIARTTDHGVLDKDSIHQAKKESGRDTADMAKSFSRYNLLFTQALNILVPCNLNLKVGNVIKCEFPRVQE